MNNNLHRSTDIYTRYHTNDTTPQYIDAEQLIKMYEDLEEIARSIEITMIQLHQTIQRNIAGVVQVVGTLKNWPRSDGDNIVLDPEKIVFPEDILKTFFDPHDSQAKSEVQQHKQTGKESNNKKQTRPIPQRTEL